MKKTVVRIVLFALVLLLGRIWERLSLAQELREIDKKYGDQPRYYGSHRPAIKFKQL